MADSYPLSDHFNGDEFSNPSGSTRKKTSDLFKWWREDKSQWPDKVPLKPQLPLVWDINTEEIHISFVNHASFLIRSADWSLITDPHFTKRASPFSFIGPQRVHQPGVKIEDIQKLDYAFISHNHYDHLDLPSLKLLQKRFPQIIFLVPLGNERLLQSQGLKNVQSVDWWQNYSVPNSTLTLVPAQHWSKRGLFDYNKNLWGGLFIERKGRRLFFAGDTGYADHFKQIRERLGEPDIALLPIGAYEPRWFMKQSHMNPEEAVKAHMDLKSDMSIGMHFGCFQLTNEAIDQPQKDLLKALQEHKIQQSHFLVPDPGQTVVLN